MIRRAGAGLALLLAAACGREESAPAFTLEAGLRTAWIGEAGDGLRVVAEGMAAPGEELEDALAEEQMLRKALRVDPGLALLRLHLLGPAAELAAPGRISRSPGEEFSSLPPSPDEESARTRLLRAGLAEGGPAPTAEDGAIQRRTFLLASPGQPPGADTALRWERGSRSIPLRIRAWTERERRDFIDADGARQPPHLNPLPSSDD